MLLGKLRTTPKMFVSLQIVNFKFRTYFTALIPKIRGSQSSKRRCQDERAERAKEGTSDAGM